MAVSKSVDIRYLGMPHSLLRHPSQGYLAVSLTFSLGSSLYLFRCLMVFASFESKCSSTMDWFEGKSTGNHVFYMVFTPRTRGFTKEARALCVRHTCHRDCPALGCGDRNKTEERTGLEETDFKHVQMTVQMFCFLRKFECICNCKIQ